MIPHMGFVGSAACNMLSFAFDECSSMSAGHAFLLVSDAFSFQGCVFQVLSPGCWRGGFGDIGWCGAGVGAGHVLVGAGLSELLCKHRAGRRGMGSSQRLSRSDERKALAYS